ncbi:bolA-like protein 3 [Diadema setosum]|uniref:bolA-like protein 3 n=1 Tax=Diadema setosum TaxID=31175 RepID=UPI003B3A2FE0
MFRAVIRSSARMLAALRPRALSGVSPITEGEQKIKQVLQEKFPEATSIEVEDISGGCGAMYQVHVESTEFQGKRTVQQHKMVNKALSEEVKQMHGLRITTTVPEAGSSS